MEVGRPKQTTQPSRKGKKAWRKHIDIDEINSGLEANREIERTLGSKDLTTTDQSNLYAVDTAGNEGLAPKRVRESKKLKSDEILAKRSAVEPLTAVHKKKSNKLQGVSGKEVDRLMRLAGRREGESSMKASLENDGIVMEEPNYDLWDKDNSVQKTRKNFTFLTDTKAGLSFSSASKAPTTITHAPLSFGQEKALPVPHEGIAYNPKVEAWRALIQQEHERESVREKQRQVLEEQKARIEEVMLTLVDDGERMGLDQDDESEDEEQDQGQEAIALSVNAPVQRKIKTKTQRNKLKRHNQRIALDQELKTIRRQIHDLEMLPQLLAKEEEMLGTEQARALTKARKTTRKVGKYHIRDEPIEVKLSEELTDCLRRIKAEGNATSDRFRSLQRRGLIEIRMPSMHRKARTKLTEKWTFKDFK